MNAPEICCSLSHVKVYKKFIETNFDYALIFEDDAVFLNDFTEKLQKFIIRNFKYKKQIILLGELWQFYKRPLDIESDFPDAYFGIGVGRIVVWNLSVVSESDRYEI